ncbi:ABC transporter substrate-binding protein [Rubeoparvulum massiliense]|uniref:ABC transporter substrate-binding protein n=1 Tax=Rubeoparvulum massiliense TaxID=1631346 RepID=UPI00065E439D|nr:ABC transporter substrate-binding protein [Rubeoparvulum massiliense]
MKKRYWLGLVLLLMMTLVWLPGCGSNGESTTADQPKEAQPAVESEAWTPVEITDALDQKLVIEQEPKRIVSTIPSNTEILFALGAGSKVVGVSDWDNYPEEVTSITKIGGIDLNIEGIMALAPDLVFAHQSSATAWADGLEQLRQAGINVVVVNDATSFDEVYRSIEMVAQAIGEPTEGEQLVTSMKEQFAEIEKKAASIPENERPKVWVEISEDLYTAGSGTFIDEMLKLLHANNIAGDQAGWFQLNEEDVIVRQPDIILSTYGYYVPNAKELILARTGWGHIPAIQSGQVYDVDSDMVTRPGPRLVDGVIEMAKVLYPQLFNE